MPTTESPAATIGQAAVAVALIVGAAVLAYIDPPSRGIVEGVFTASIGTVIGYFFSQRAAAAGQHAATNGMSTMAGLIATAVPGPVGPAGETGPPGTAHP